MVKVEGRNVYDGGYSKVGEDGNKEKPVHKVTLTRNYYIGKYEVTQSPVASDNGYEPFQK